MWAVSVLCLRSAGARLERWSSWDPRCSATPLPSQLAHGALPAFLPPLQNAFPSSPLLIPTTKKWLHAAPAFNFFVPGATPHFLQLLLKAWPFHLLHSQRISLSSHNLSTSRDAALQLQSHFAGSRLGVFSTQIAFVQLNTSIPWKALNFPAPLRFF